MGGSRRDGLVGVGVSLGVGFEVSRDLHHFQGLSASCRHSFSSGVFIHITLGIKASFHEFLALLIKEQKNLELDSEESTR